jgi:transposase
MRFDIAVGVSPRERIESCSERTCLEGTAFFSLLLPETTSLRLDAWRLDTAASGMTVSVTSTQTSVPCPGCTVPTARIHSRDTRTRAALPWAAYRVRLQLRVRKWFCANPACGRRIFTARLPTVAAPWARRTRRLVQRLIALGLALGGRAGVRLSQAWDVAVSRPTLRRGLRRHPVPVLPTPMGLGVDDFALRKGQTYGTGLLDLERRQPVALLPDRTADTLAQWLQAHPGVQVIARDRATAYADGARQGAPPATQVADRWHLLRHLAETLEQVFHQHRRVLQNSHVPSAGRPLALADQSAVIEAPAPSPTAQPAALLPPSAGASPRHTHRRLRYEQVCPLARQGWTFRAIAQQVGLHRKTVAPYVRSDSFPVRGRPQSRLDPYKPSLLACWNRGCRTGRRLYEDMQRQGYQGGRSTVLGYFTQLRKAQGLAPRTRTTQPAPPVTDPTVQHLTPRQATWLTRRQPTEMTEREQHLLILLHHAHTAFAQASALAQGFAQRLRARQPERLDAWVQQAATSSLAAFQRLAKSFPRDYAAVKAGVTLPWSSGPVEGHINRLQMLKRQMFGRARLDLLSRRFVLAPHEGHAQAPGQPVPAQAYREAAAA